MNWLKKFMIGRYGSDNLSVFLLILSIILTFASSFARNSVLMTMSYIPLFIALYRMFSKNIQKRSMESYKFAMLVSPIYSRYKRFLSRIRASKTHKYFKCTTCKTNLRVPKGKGKILITCPNCKKEFIKRT
ncbi:UNVERIFIED_CONTAM: hypothetical protein Cloal_2322 [Acetivibrio alkalicellulosi]